MKQLSRSVGLMFIFDLLVFVISTYCFANMFCSLKITILATMLVTVVGLFSFFLKGQYKVREHNLTAWNAYRLLEGVVFANIPVGILLFFLVPKLVLVKFLGLNILTIFVVLAIYRACFHYYLFNFKKVKRVLIIGANDNAKAVVDVIKNKKALQMEVVGVVKSAEIDKKLSEGLSQSMHYQLTESDIAGHEFKLKDEKSFNYEDIRLFEDGKNIVEIQKETNPDIVVLATKSFLIPAINDNAKVYLMSDFYEMATGKFFVHEDLMPNFYVEFAQFERSFKGKLYKLLKRIYDIIAALIILTVTLPITGYIAIRVWLIDKESPFFTQTRVGLRGKSFECYKLRTMYSNNYVPKNAQMLNDGSDRVIPFCKFIRKAKLDEIPQMVNILRGEMSIVGPRAEWDEFTNVFKNDVPFHEVRTYVKAGWTGWAHVSMPAAYSVDEERERLCYDLYYIKHRNVLWEIGILVKAVFMAISGRHL